MFKDLVCMIDILVTKAKGFLLAPVETFQSSKTDEPVLVFTYLSVLLLIDAILSSVIAMFVVPLLPGLTDLPIGIPLRAIGFLEVFIGSIIITIIFSVWLHFWVYILGGRKGLMQTVYAFVYGGTPWMLFGWIPFLSIIFTVWSVVLWIMGVRELQEMSTGKAVAAVLIAIIIPLVVLILILAAFAFGTWHTLQPTEVIRIG